MLPGEHTGTLDARCKRTMEILSAVTGGGDGGVNPALLAPFVKPVTAQQEVLANMKLVLAKQVPHLCQYTAE